MLSYAEFYALSHGNIGFCQVIFNILEKQLFSVNEKYF
jgi:hypothetical protein